MKNKPYADFCGQYCPLTQLLQYVTAIGCYAQLLMVLRVLVYILLVMTVRR